MRKIFTGILKLRIKREAGKNLSFPRRWESGINKLSFWGAKHERRENPLESTFYFYTFVTKSIESFEGVTNSLLLALLIDFLFSSPFKQCHYPQTPNLPVCSFFVRIVSIFFFVANDFLINHLEFIDKMLLESINYSPETQTKTSFA
jgi:hypothetical protein